MLKRLYISNYALIEELDVTFPGQLTVITGETGAGKSIFLEALGLVLGNRADAGSLQDKSKKCIIEAEFDIKNYGLEWFFNENELDYESSLILRREINGEGKSRSFINDSPVTLTQIKQLAENLVDIHSQHQTLLLNQSKFQLQLVDAFAQTIKDFDVYAKDFSKLNSLRQKAGVLLETEKQAKKDLDYFQFLYNELNEFEIRPGEVKSLEEESNMLENTEQIKSILNKCAALINSNDENLLTQLSLLKQQINSVSKYNNDYKLLSDRINALYIELKDIGNELEQQDENLIFDPEKLQVVNDKLDKINRLFKKHSVNTAEELLTIKNEIEVKLNQFNSLENEIEKTNKEIAVLEAGCKKQALALSKKRSASIPEIESKINALLSELAMPNARFKVNLEQNTEITSNGIDQISFLFSANKGGEFKELQKVASGGEMSRLMLSIKSVLAEKKSLPSIIFDEIDTGISGDVADKMGSIFMQMAKNMQVISITHLPQIASKGSHHLFVYKNDDKEKTRSFIKTLNNKERIVEIAKMLSTGKPTESAIKNAEELLSN